MNRSTERSFGWYCRMAALAIASAVSGGGSLAHAQTTDTWTGTAGDGSWSTASNWNPVATPAGGDSLIFTSASGATTSLTDDDNVSFAALTFNASSAGYTIGAGGAVTTLTLTGALTDQSSNGATQTFNLGISGVGLTLTGAGNSSLALNNGGTFTGGLTDTSNGATADTLAIGAGKTLSFATASAIGAPAGTANTTTALSVTGTSASTLTLTNSLTVGGNANTGTGTANTVTTNLSGIGVFNLTSTAGVLSIATAQQTNATLTLANTSNTINVGSVNVGLFANSFAAGATIFSAALHLGGGTNTFNVGTAAATPGTILIGSGLNGTIDFAGPTGSITIAGFNGATGTNGANITVGESRTVTTVTPTVTSTLALAGHPANIDAKTVIVGLNDSTPFNPGANVAKLTFDTGTFNVQTLQIARETNSHGTMNATFTLGTNSASTGILNVATEFDILDNTVNDGNAQAGTFIINGGTANLQTSIVVKATGANTASKITSTLTMAGGTLNMNGNAIGASGNSAGGDSALVKNVNMPGSGQTFTIKNLGTTTLSGGAAVGDGINGAGLTMNGAGTLILDGTNTYGQTTVSSGTLRVGAGSSTGTPGTGSVTVNGALLQFNRSDAALSVANSIGGNLTGTVQQFGSGTTTLTGSNNYLGPTLISNGTLALSTTGTNNIASSSGIIVNGGAKFDVTQVTGFGGFALAGTQTLTNSGIVSGNVTALSGGTVAGTGGTFNGPSGNNTVTISGGALVPGTLTTTGTMTMSNLAVPSSGWAIKVGGASSDSITVSGTASFANNGVLSINQLSKPTNASYTVLTAGNLTGLTAGVLQTLGRTTYSIDSPALAANTLKLDVTGAPAAVAWTGSDGTLPSQWDNTQATANWLRTDGGGGDTTHFYDGDNVTFDDSHNTGGQYAINIATNVAPGSIAVTTSGHTYSFGGSSIASGSLLMNSGDGTGILTINTSNNSFVLGTTVQSGTLNANATGALGTQAVTVNGGTLNLNAGSALGNNPLSMSSGNFNIGASGALGSGTLTLSGGTFDNTSGSATILNNNPQIWDGSFTFLGSNTALDTTHDIDMGTGTVTLNTNAAVTIAGAASTLTVGGIVQNGTGAGFTKSGPGTLVLNGANSYTGATTVAGGTVLVNSSNSLGAIPGGSVTIAGGATLDITVLSGAANALNFGQKQFFIAGNGADGVEGAIVNRTGGLAQQNAFQRVALTADASIGGASRFDIRAAAVGGVNQAALDLAGHTLTKNGIDFIGLVAADVSDGSLIVNGGLVNGVPTVGSTLDFETTTNVVNNNSGASLTFNSGSIAYFFNYTGTLSRPMNLNGGATIGNDTNNTAVVASNITLGGTGTVTVTNLNNNGTGTLTLNGNIGETGGPHSLTKNVTTTTGAISTLILGGNNTFTGGLTINGGVVLLTNAGALNSTTPNTVTFGSGAPTGTVLRLNGNSITLGGLVSDFNAGIVDNTSAIAATLTVSNAVDNVFDDTLVNGTGAGALSLTKAGAGTLTLGGVNTYTGTTTVTAGTLSVGDSNNASGSIAATTFNVQGGTLRLGFNNAIPAAASITLGSGTSSGVFDLAGRNQTVASLTNSGTGTANIVGNSGASASTLTFAGGTSSFGGIIQDVLGGGTSTTALTVTGDSLTLTGASTHTGGTNINGGTLTVTGSLAANAPVSLNNTGTLSGNGSVGDVTMQPGSFVRPGLTAANGVLGNLTMNSLTVNGGDLRVDLAAGNHSDELIVTNIANFAGASTITPTSSSPPPGTYLLLAAGMPVTGVAPSTPSAARTSYTLHFGDATSGADNMTLVVVGSAKTLTWTGNAPGDGTTWDIETTQNWSDNGGATTNEKFFNQDSVIFGDGSHRAITLNQIVQPGAVTFSNDANNPYILSGSGAIDGPTNLTVSGGGTVTITTNNTYNGTTAVNSGSTLRVGDPTVNSGTSGSLGVGPITVDGTVAFDHSDLATLANVISGAGVVQQIGAGTLALTGANSYTGGTVFNAGTVQAAADNNLGGAAGPLTFNGGTLESTASFSTARGTTINAPGGFFNVDSGITLTHSGIITGAGVLHASGPGTLVLAASNTFTGGLSIDNGVVQVDNAGALNSTTPNAVSFPANVPAGAMLQLNGISVTVGGLNTDLVHPGSAVVDNSSTTAATLTVKSAATNTFGGVLENTGTGKLSLAMTGGGTLVLGGNNTFTGLTTINGSTIQTAVAGNLVGLAGQVNFINGTLHITGDPTDPTAVITAANTSNKFSNSGNAGVTGTFNIDAGVSFQVGATVTQTVAALQTAGTGPNGSGTAGGSFIKTGLGTMIIYGQNNQQDTNFQLQQGTIDLRSARGLGGEDSNAVRLDMSSGTTLILDADPGFNNVTVTPPAGLTGTDFLTGLRSATAGGTINVTVDQLTAGPANNQAFGAMQAAGAFTMNVTSGPNMTSGTAGLFLDQNNNQTGGGFNGAVALSGNGTFNVVTNTAAGASGMLMTINGPVTGTGFGVIKTGTGTLLLNGVNTYSGATTVSGGTLRVANASVNSIPSSPTITVGSGANFDVTGLTGGTLVLGSGATAQTLTGSGTVTGSVTVNAGSAIGGASGGTLTVTGGVSLQDQSHSAFTLGAPNGSGNPLTSLVNIAGALSVTGTNLVDLSGAAQTGTYELYAFTSGTPTSSRFKVNSNAAGAFSYAFSVIANQEVDIVVTPDVSASWNFNGNGNYSESAKWSPTNVPNAAGLTATFGNGVPAGTVAPPPSVVTVTIDGAYTVGTLQFNNSAIPNSTQYILGNDAVSGHGITLSNNGAGATVAVATGVNTQQQILTNLLLADNVTFNVAGGTSLLISVGSIGQSGGNRSLMLTGGGTLTIDSASSYGGGTTVANGTLNTTATGTLGSGPLAITAVDTIQSAVNLGSNQTVSALSGTLAGSGTARVIVAAGTTLTVDQATPTTFAGNVMLATGGSANGGGTLTKSGAGTLEIDGAPTLNANSNLNVTGGTLRFALTPTSIGSGSVFVGTGVTATVSSSAVLELAGSVSALDPVALKGNANVVNNSTAPAGLLVSGTNQLVGFVDGAGTTQVNDGSDLTASHIVQGALVIGVTGSSPSLVTIDASDSNGNPLGQSGGFALAGSLAPSAPFASSALSGSTLLASAGSLGGGGSSQSGIALGSVSLGGSVSAVPEPAAFVLLGLGGLVCLLPRLRRLVACKW